jgi:hypothetical protein
MNIRKLPNGDLAMSALPDTQDDIRALLANDDPDYGTMISKEAWFISDYLGNDPMGDGVSYEQVAPEEIGALTSAPLISDGENIYGYMNYQVLNFLEELAAGNEITWQKG